MQGIDGIGKFLQKTIRKRRVVGVLLFGVVLLSGLGVGYSVWNRTNSTAYSAWAQCGVNEGAYCPGQFTWVHGEINVSQGIPDSIVFLSFDDSNHVHVSMPSLTTPVFTGHGLYGYGLFLPAYVIIRGFTLKLYNSTFQPGSAIGVIYHVEISYHVDATIETCAADNAFVPTIAEWDWQNFSC